MKNISKQVFLLAILITSTAQIEAKQREKDRQTVTPLKNRENSIVVAKMNLVAPAVDPMLVLAMHFLMHPAFSQLPQTRDSTRARL